MCVGFIAKLFKIIIMNNYKCL